jgi:hypothetical protein
MIYASTGQPFEARMVNGPTGLFGTVGVRVLDNQGAIVTARHTTGIIEDPAGSGSYVANLTAPLTIGQFTVLWDTDPAGVASPVNSTVEDLVVVSGASVQVIPGDPGDGTLPCSPWTTAATVKARYPDLAAALDADIDNAISIADDWLYQLSGRRFRGVCTRRVRPCRSSCGCWWSANGIYHWTGGIWSNGTDRCGCGCVASVRLVGPVREIVSVEIGGVLVDPDTYRVDNRVDLVRIAGNGGWPTCQNLDLPSGDPGTFEVVYRYGRIPPIAGVEAAIALAAEIYKSMHPGTGTCVLPAGVTQVVRQGVTINRKAVEDVTGALSALPLVAAFLAAYNPKRILRRPAVWSPDVQRPARRVGT